MYVCTSLPLTLWPFEGADEADAAAAAAALSGPPAAALDAAVCCFDETNWYRQETISRSFMSLAPVLAVEVAAGFCAALSAGGDVGL